MKLPDKPSELITLALHDEDKAHKSKKYKVDMGFAWHEPNGACSVCLAGSVMAFSLNADIKKPLIPTDMGDEEERKLRALNFVRMGDINTTLNLMNVRNDAIIEDVEVTDYSEDRNEWRKDMRGIVKLLKSKGL